MGTTKRTSERVPNENKKRPASLRTSYRVALPHVPPRVIDDCSTPEEAYERYQQLNGILSSEFEPEIESVRSDEVTSEAD